MEENGAQPAQSQEPLLTPPIIRRLSSDLGVQPTKKLGQNFLHDPGTVRKIVATSRANADDVILEVGPGLGSLTLGLLDTGARVCAVEIDPPLAEQLPRTVRQYRAEADNRLRVHLSDALDLRSWEACGANWPPPTRLVANLPYNVAVPILLHCLSLFPSLKSALIMVQSEVADRLVAAPNSKTYGVPSVKARWYGFPKRAGAIGRSVFWPAPNVDSALVDLQLRDTPRGDEQLREATFRVVDAAFAQRRKMVRASLRALTDSPGSVAQMLEQANVDQTLRGENLGIDAYVSLGEAALDVAAKGDVNLALALSAGRGPYA